MRSVSRWTLTMGAALAGMISVTLVGRVASGQEPVASGDSVPRIAQTPQSNYPRQFPSPPTTATPSQPDAGTAYGQPSTGAGNNGTGPPEVPPGPTFADAALGSEESVAMGGQNFAAALANPGPAYIDSAIIRSQFRVRYDSAYDMNTPDRAEFFYPKCGCFSMLPTTSPLFDRRALGPSHFTPKTPIPGHLGLSYPGESRADFQEVATYLEYAANTKTSMFIEMPARFNNFQLHKNTYGWSDMNLGFKRAFIANPNQFYTFQFRTYVPTGSGEKGLGTNHATLEPALLIFQRLSDRLFLNAEFRDWIPVHATNFAGNILRYGVGLTYNIVLSDHVRVAPVTEFVGWTVLSGQKLVPNENFDGSANSLPFQILSAAGDTIINGKFGLRFGVGNYNQPGGGSNINDRQSLYVGYGQALTGDHWYKEILRVEYNFWF